MSTATTSTTAELRSGREDRCAACAALPRVDACLGTGHTLIRPLLQGRLPSAERVFVPLVSGAEVGHHSPI